MAAQKKDLEKIVGSGNVVDDEKTLQAYCRDQSFAEPRMPDVVVFTETVEQVRAVVRLANTTLTPVIPYSSGKNMHGAAIPDHGGIVLNMSRMNNILAIDEDNWCALIEPGVTYRQLQETLMKKGYRVMIPFGAVPERSVLTSYLERDPVMAAPSFEHGNALIMDTEVVLPDGELFKTGNWASGGAFGAPNGPIRNCIYRLWTGAQGTLGILTKMVVQIEPVPTSTKVYFSPFSSLRDALEPLKRIQRKEIGMECFLLNSFNLAALFAEGWAVPQQFPVSPAASPDFEDLRTTMPPWTLIICIHGGYRRTEEKTAYESEALIDLCDMLNVELLEGLPAVPGAERIMAGEIVKPWTILKKFNYRGSVHDLTFKAPLKKLPELEKIVHDVAEGSGYSARDLGMYLLPLERGRAVHAEFDFHCPGEEGHERSRVKAAWMQASSDLINAGAYFDRPYGPWADMMYSRAAHYTIMLKKLKAETDPNNILNPGKLCFT